jgi:hypothetical protein
VALCTWLAAVDVRERHAGASDPAPVAHTFGTRLMNYRGGDAAAPPLRPRPQHVVRRLMDEVGYPCNG